MQGERDSEWGGAVAGAMTSTWETGSQTLLALGAGPQREMSRPLPRAHLLLARQRAGMRLGHECAHDLDCATARRQRAWGECG